MNTANESSPNALQTESCPSPQSLRTCVSSYSPVQPQSIEELRTWLAAASPANPSAKQESGREPTTNEICGPQLSTPSAQYDRDTHSWRTCQDFFGQVTLGESWETWPKAGTIVAGAFYPQPKWARRINEIVSGLWATPPATDGERGGTVTENMESMSLTQQINTPHRWPTPTGDDANNATRNSGAFQSLTRAVGGKLNPRWVEWLMDMPEGWLSYEPLATHKWQQWRQLHGIS